MACADTFPVELDSGRARRKRFAVSLSGGHLCQQSSRARSLPLWLGWFRPASLCRQGALSQASLLFLEPVGPELADEDQDSTRATGGHRMCLKV